MAISRISKPAVMTIKKPKLPRFWPRLDKR
jgi:hypothetical protein